jgi:hypothetical protein
VNENNTLHRSYIYLVFVGPAKKIVIIGTKRQTINTTVIPGDGSDALIRSLREIPDLFKNK